MFYCPFLKRNRLWRKLHTSRRSGRSSTVISDLLEQVPQSCSVWVTYNSLCFRVELRFKRRHRSRFSPLIQTEAASEFTLRRKTLAASFNSLQSGGSVSSQTLKHCCLPLHGLQCHICFPLATFFTEESEVKRIKSERRQAFHVTWRPVTCTAVQRLDHPVPGLTTADFKRFAPENPVQQRRWNQTVQSDRRQSDLIWSQRTCAHAAAPLPSNSAKVLKGLEGAPDRWKGCCHPQPSGRCQKVVKCLCNFCLLVCLLIFQKSLPEPVWKRAIIFEHLWRGNLTLRKRKRKQRWETFKEKQTYLALNVI